MVMRVKFIVASSSFCKEGYKKYTEVSCHGQVASAAGRILIVV